MIVMVRGRTSYTTKVLLTTKLLFAPRFAFSSFIPLGDPVNPHYTSRAFLLRSALERDETDIHTIYRHFPHSRRAKILLPAAPNLPKINRLHTNCSRS
jgi:hypothetical protein